MRVCAKCVKSPETVKAASKDMVEKDDRMLGIMRGNIQWGVGQNKAFYSTYSLNNKNRKQNKVNNN